MEDRHKYVTAGDEWARLSPADIALLANESRHDVGLPDTSDMFTFTCVHYSSRIISAPNGHQITIYYKPKHYWY